MPISLPSQARSEASGGPLSGTIKRIKDGYGFIRGEDGKDYFIHWTSVAKESRKGFRELVEGDEVEFNWHATEKGPRATDVTVT